MLTKKSVASGEKVSKKKSVKKVSKKAVKKVAKKAAKSKEVTPSVSYAPLDEIKYHKLMEPRVDKGKIEELTDSIRRVGLINPLGVFVAGDTKYLVAGDRRLTALQALAKNDPKSFKKKFSRGVPISVVAADLEKAQLVHLAENISREDPDHVAIATTLHHMSTVEDIKTPKIAKSIGMSNTFVRDHIRFMATASAIVVKALKEKRISFKDALDVIKLAEPKEQEAAAKELGAAKELPRGDKEKKKRDVRAKTKAKAKGSEDATSAPTKRDVLGAADRLKELSFTSAKKRVSYNEAQLYYVASLGLRYAIGEITRKHLEVALESPIEEMAKAKNAYEEMNI